MNAIYVAIGSAAGGVARWLLGTSLQQRAGGVFPVGTLAVNVAGSFLVGVLAVLVARQGGEGTMLRLLLMVGFCGGFTTMSAFSLDTVTLVERGETALAAVNVLATLALSFAGTFAGLLLARLFVAPRAG